MKLLHVITSVDPKHGGPIAGVTQLAKIYPSLGVDAAICSISDSPSSEYVQNSKVKVHALGPVTSKYSYNSRLIPWLKEHAHQYDAVIVNGLWQYSGFAVRRALAGTSTPYFVFTHGMLDPWFKHTYPLKHLKKWLYWPWGEYRVLRDAKKVIFTCEDERLLARNSFWLYKVREAVTAYGAANPPANADELISAFLSNYPHLQGKRIVLFLSRIHEKKGCDLLIDAFAKVAHRDENLHLVIAGPDQTGWGTKLKMQAEALGVSERISWPGMLQNEMKWGAFYAAEVFCLPSHQENFGIVVAEALSCGKPVLISNKVNIWREIKSDGAGLVADDTLSGTISNFERWLEMVPQDFQVMKMQTTKCFSQRFHIQRATERLLEIIREENT